jgi:hypothetical protein
METSDAKKRPSRRSAQRKAKALLKTKPKTRYEIAIEKLNNILTSGYARGATYMEIIKLPAYRDEHAELAAAIDEMYARVYTLDTLFSPRGSPAWVAQQSLPDRIHPDPVQEYLNRNGRLRENAMFYRSFGDEW